MKKRRFDPTKPNTYVRYGRMSTPRQNPRSPDQQFDTIEATIRRLGYLWIHLCDFRDDGISGRYMRKRPGFCEMLTAIRTGRLKVDFILVDTLERFGRMSELTALRHELETKYGVLILTADTNFADPTSVAGQALGLVESIRATSDAHTKGHNVRRGRVDAARRKRWLGGRAPLGYRLEAVVEPGLDPAVAGYHRLVVDPKTAPLVQRFFTLSRERGWGAARIAKHLNSDAEFVAKHGTIRTSRVHCVLCNPLYTGVLRCNLHTTAVVDDRRTTFRNDDADAVQVPDYCEALVSREVFDHVAQRRRERAERIRAAQAAARDGSGKRIRPLAGGVVLTYPLSGLVRCAECGSAMTAHGGSQRGYYYYGCTGFADGRCSNSRKARGDWLWQKVVAALRERLFPLGPVAPDNPPGWLPGLMAEVRAELARHAAPQAERIPALQREIGRLDDQIAGWIQSLADPTLAPAARQLVQAELDAAVAAQRQKQIERDQLAHESKRGHELLDSAPIVARLQQLDRVLADGSPTEVNVALARHIDQICVHGDGTIMLHFNRLGIFEGVAELLAQAAGGPGRAGTDPGAERAEAPRPPRRLLTRRVSNLGGDPNGQTQLAPQSDHRPSTLPARWISTASFATPGFYSKAAKIASEAARLRAGEDGRRWTMRELAAHFHVSRPTIRRALRIAGQQPS